MPDHTLQLPLFAITSHNTFRELPKIIPLPSKRINDLANKVFGHLTVIGFIGKNRWKAALWLCKCECGNYSSVGGHMLTNNRTKSCGCLTGELNRKNKTVHGLRGTPEYRTWSSMKTRCENKNLRSYKDYGGRGITICARWRYSLNNFIEDMKQRPGQNYSIERIDNDGHYSCGHCEQCQREGWTANCRWATASEQGNNKRDSHFLEFNGKRMTISQWAKETGINPGTLCSRIVQGWSVEDTLTRTVRQRKTR